MAGHCGRHRPNIHIRPTLAGQQLPNLKSQKVRALYLAYKNMREKKLEGGYVPRYVRVKIFIYFMIIKVYD